MKKPDFIEPSIMQQYMFPGARLYVVPLGDTVSLLGVTVSAYPTDLLQGGQKLVTEFQEAFEKKIPNETVKKLFNFANKTIHSCHLSFPFEIKMKTWANGRIVLIGDAAHAVVSSPGQAMDLATTDSFRLADVLANEANTKGIDQAIADFIKIRYPQVYRIQKESYKSFVKERAGLFTTEWSFFKRLFTHNTWVLNWIENRETRKHMAEAAV